MSPAGLSLGLHPHPVSSVTSTASASASAAERSSTGLNAAATELARLSDRAAAATASVVPAPGLAAWCLPPFTAASVDTPSRLERAVADEQNKNFDDYSNKQRCVETHACVTKVGILFPFVTVKLRISCTVA